MIPRALTALLLMSGIAAILPAVAGDRTLRDAGQPSYRLLIPDGWDGAPRESAQGSKAVELKRGGAAATLLIKSGVAQPGAVLVQVRSQFQEQWKSFSEIESGQTTLGGRKAAYAVYSGVPPRGGYETTKVVTMTDGQFTYLLFLEAPANEFNSAKRDLDRIQSSFALAPADAGH